MRTFLCFLTLVSAAFPADNLPITRLAGAAFKVADIEKARQFYTGLMGLEEAFDLKDSSGSARSIFFKVNDEQYLEFSPGAPDSFQLEHLSLLTPELKKMESMLRERGVTPGKTTHAADGTLYFPVKDPDNHEVDFVQYVAGSKEAEYRGKALGARRISDHLQHMGLPADQADEFMAFYTGKLGFREMFRGGPNNEIRWINLAIPGTPGDILELMIMAAQPKQGRRHIAFEVPDMERAYKELLARGLPPNSKPNEGPKQNHRWILNLRDPNGLRVEIMGEMVTGTGVK